MCSKYQEVKSGLCVKKIENKLGYLMPTAKQLLKN